MKAANEKYCSNCGELIAVNAEICPKCGVRQMNGSSQNYSPFAPIYTGDPMVSSNSWLITLLLCVFLGPLGVHRFYNDKIFTGILQLITFGGCGIWYIIDLIMILIGQFKDGQGRAVKYL